MFSDKFIEFKTHILDIHEANADSKLKEYFDRVLDEVKKLDGRDITVITRIREMNAKEFKVQSLIHKRFDEDFGD